MQNFIPAYMKGWTYIRTLFSEPTFLECIGYKTGPARSEYRFSFTPKVKLVQPHIKLASSFMYRRPPDSIRGQPRESFQPGFVPAARSGWLDDYVFLHSNAFYSNNKEKRTYFTVRPDWVSERCVRKNNPFS